MSKLSIAFTMQVLLLAGLIGLGACSTGAQAPSNATISDAADGPGFLVVGVSDSNAVSTFLHQTTGLGLDFERQGGGTIEMNRLDSCGTLGLLNSIPCDMTRPALQVLKVSAGEWRLYGARDVLHVPAIYKLLTARVLVSNWVHVKSGEIVYIGDYVLASDFDHRHLVVLRHSRDDEAATQAVASYAGLRDHPIVYRDPVASAPVNSAITGTENP